jgi:hypothetical protein
MGRPNKFAGFVTDALPVPYNPSQRHLCLSVFICGLSFGRAGHRSAPTMLARLEMEESARRDFALIDVMAICAEETAECIADDLIISRADISWRIASLETQPPFFA